MVKRCFSKCRGLKQNECTKPCSFVNDQYCRLSSTLKMIPPDCRMIKRSNLSRKSPPRKSRKRSKVFKRPVLDHAICSDSGVCISFGKNSLNFKCKEFTYAVSSQKIDDGLVIHYKKEHFQTHALFKSYQQYNLAYEYVAGQYLNKLSKKSPLFLETYGLYVYPDKEERKRIEDSTVNLKTSLIPITPDKGSMICGNPELVCLLVQHIQEATSLTHYTKVPHFFIHDALYVFYSIYFTLSMLRKVFTHYHLTCKQVLLYKPVKNGYIDYHYHLPKEVVRFRSPYLVRVKDYGNCFFKGSNLYQDTLCRETRCQVKCKSPSFMHPSKEDERQDLGLLRDYQQLSKMKSHPNKYIQSFVKVFEDLDPGSGFSKKIQKVSDVEKRLRVLIQDPVRQRINQLSHEKYQKLGELHIYTNGKEVEFISQKNI